MRSCEGKLVKHRDGRVGYCVSSRPRGQRLTVLVAGREEFWGPREIDDAELCRLMGVQYNA